MVRILYLLRHGQAVSDFYMKDFDRPLTTYGINQLTQLGTVLQMTGIHMDKIYCSPANRTRQTLDVILEKIGSHSPVEFRDEIYEASVRTLFDLVTKTEESIKTLLLIGHNPGISYLVDYLTSGAFGDMSPGKLVKIIFQDLEWGQISKGLGYLDSF